VGMKGRNLLKKKKEEGDELKEIKVVKKPSEKKKKLKNLEPVIMSKANRRKQRQRLNKKREKN